MSDTIEQKCLAKGVKLTDQRKLLQGLFQRSKKNYGESIILMLMNFIKEFLKLIQK